MNRITNRICALVLVVALLVTGVFMAPVSAFADGVEPVGGIYSSGSNPSSAGTSWSGVTSPSAGTVWSPVNTSPSYSSYPVYSVKKPTYYSVKKPYVPTYYSYPSYSYASWYGGYGGPSISFNFNKNKNSNTNTNVVNVNGGGSNNNSNDDEPRCDIDADDTSIDEGDSTTIRWDSDDADEARINQGIGNVGLSGSRNVSPNNTTTYTLTVENDEGTDTCSVTIHVDEDNDNDEDPWCEIDASDTTVDEGDRVTLEWDTRNAEEARINQGIGSVDEDGGEERVTVDETTTFRMTVENNDGDEDTCSVTVRVDEDDVVLTSLPTDNPLTSVYLSQVPYTGFDLGPYAALYWTLFVLFGAAAAYAVIFMVIPRLNRKVKALEAAAQYELEEDGDE